MTATVNHDIEKAARAHQERLTKPQGSLGRLEDIACWFAGRQGRVNPEQLRPHIAVFAADHGVVAEGVSAFPSVVTGEMVKNFARGGAAINVLARRAGATLSIVDVGVAVDVANVEGVVHAKVQAGTANLLRGPAMDMAACNAAMDAGREQARSAVANGANLLLAGDMGIGNTTASACLICALGGFEPEDVVGHGTGVDGAGRARKVEVVRQALQRAGSVKAEQAVTELGGLEIAAIAGFYLQAAALGVPVLVDGFIATAAAMVAASVNAGVRDWMLAGHVSQEKGHRLALQALGLEPIVDLGMRLGEGSGAMAVVPLLQAAIDLHNDMATFESAGVSERDG